MQINADFDKPTLIHTEALAWTPSPMAGVDRRMLDRIGDEVARATSIVRYAKGSSFAEHTHSGGEEFIVLDGVFQDEHGDYPAGTYVRNPIGTHHIPRSDPGCTIFVKLWQFALDDQEQYAIDLNSWALEADALRLGVSHGVLAQRDYEIVSLEEWDAGTNANIHTDGGAELLVLEGSISFEDDVFGQHDWLRFPAGSEPTIAAGDAGARIWIKRGHLSRIVVPPQG